MATDTGQWLSLIEREYLNRFIPAGGSSIKFVVGDDAEIERIHKHFSAIAERDGLQFVHVDGATMKLHMIQDFFFALARAMDWEDLAQRRVEAMFHELKYEWPKPGHPVPLSELSVKNGVADNLVLLNVDRWLTGNVMRDHAMTHDFREAMTHLCRRRLEPPDAIGTIPIIDWLRGDLRALGAVRPVPIGSKINRTNARSMLRSLCHWQALARNTGILVVLDIRWITERERSEAGIRYTPAAILDAFEVLRQIVDEADRLEGLFLVVAAGASILDGDTRRSFDAYPALKGRIVADVTAKMHDNPLSPLVRLSSTPQAPRTEILSSGEIPLTAERLAIEALRAGVPNEAAIRLLRNSDHPLADGFVDDLRTIARTADRPPVLEGRIVAGGFGSGKSHLLGGLSELAQNQNFIVSHVAISKETPLFNLERVFAAAVRNAIVPDINDDVMSVAISRLDPSSGEFATLEDWASTPKSGLSPIFAAILYVLPRQVLGPEDKVAIARFLGGGKLLTSRVRQWLRALGAHKIFDLRAVRAPEMALQKLRFAPALFRAAGFSGWCVLLDEVELIGRYGSLQRAKSYGELCRWLGLEPVTAVSGLIAVATIVDDFRSIVLDGRLDQERVPALLQQKGLDQLAVLASIAMRAIEERQVFLKPPNHEQLTRDQSILRNLYQRSYDWTPVASDLGEQRAAKTIREFIKSWITDWDIQRLYGAQDEIETQSLGTDYTENKDLEKPSSPDADDD